jgi:hypothetical protein
LNKIKNKIFDNFDYEYDFLKNENEITIKFLNNEKSKRIIDNCFKLNNLKLKSFKSIDNYQHLRLILNTMKKNEPKFFNITLTYYQLISSICNFTSNFLKKDDLDFYYYLFKKKDKDLLLLKVVVDLIKNKKYFEKKYKFELLDFFYNKKNLLNYRIFENLVDILYNDDKKIDSFKDEKIENKEVEIEKIKNEEENEEENEDEKKIHFNFFLKFFLEELKKIKFPYLSDKLDFLFKKSLKNKKVKEFITKKNALNLFISFFENFEYDKDYYNYRDEYVIELIPIFKILSLFVENDENKIIISKKINFLNEIEFISSRMSDDDSDDEGEGDYFRQRTELFYILLSIILNLCKNEDIRFEFKVYDYFDNLIEKNEKFFGNFVLSLKLEDFFDLKEFPNFLFEEKIYVNFLYLMHAFLFGNNKNKSIKFPEDVLDSFSKNYFKYFKYNNSNIQVSFFKLLSEKNIFNVLEHISKKDKKIFEVEEKNNKLEKQIVELKDNFKNEIFEINIEIKNLKRKFIEYEEKKENNKKTKKK